MHRRIGVIATVVSLGIVSTALVACSSQKTNRKTYYDPDGNVLEYVVSEENSYSTFDYEFDADGYMTKQIEHSGPDNNIVQEYSYDENHNNITIVRMADDDKGEMKNIYTEQREYNAENQLIKSENEDQYGEITVNEYHYNEEGQVSEVLMTKTYSGEIREQRRTEYKYNDKGQKTESLLYNIDRNGVEEKSQQVLYEYDEKGQLTLEEANALGEGYEDSYTKYEYDEHGNMTQELTIWPEEDMHQDIYEYQSVYDYVK